MERQDYCVMVEVSRAGAHREGNAALTLVERASSSEEAMDRVKDNMSALGLQIDHLAGIYTEDGLE